MAIPDQTDGMDRTSGHRAVRIVLLCIVVAAILFLAAISWLSGR